MTTIPTRVPHIARTLQSLVKQDVRADAIYIAIPRPKGSNGTARTRWPTTWPAAVTVIEPAMDYGPITRLLPVLALETDPTTKIVLVDDDIIYPRTMLAALQAGSQRHPDAAVGLSGAVLTDRFFMIGWRETQQTLDRHLFLNLSGYPTFRYEAPVDLLQAFVGLLVPRAFLDPVSLRRLAADAVPAYVTRSDDVIVAASLEAMGVPRWLVTGGSGNPVKNQATEHTTHLSRGSAARSMHRNYIRAFEYLQRRLNIWQQRVLVRWSELDDTEQRRIDCANYHEDRCPPGVRGGPRLEGQLVRSLARKFPSKPPRQASSSQ